MATEHDTQARAAAKLLGQRGGAKGGKARAAALTSEERRAIARDAITTRWERAKGQTEQGSS